MTTTLDEPQDQAAQTAPQQPGVPLGEDPPFNPTMPPEVEFASEEPFDDEPAFDSPPPDEDFEPRRPSAPLEQAPPPDAEKDTPGSPPRRPGVLVEQAPPPDFFDVAPPDVEDEVFAKAAPRPDKSIPYNLEAEEAVLGALLIDQEAILRVASFLRPEDFYIVKNSWIYDAILSLHEQRQSVDFLTVCDELENRKQIQEVGGQVYISTLINSVPTAIHVEAYAHIVERTALRRRLITAASQIAGFAYQEDQSIDEVLDRSEAVLFGISQQRIARDLTPVRIVVADYYDRIEYLYEHRGEPLGIPTSFVDLDKLLGGLQRSDLIIVAARPGVGKTSFLLGVALSAARKYKQKVGVFSLEMSNEQLVQRLISSETGIDSQRLRLADLREDEWPKFAEAAGRLSETMIFIDDTPGISAMQLRTKARRLHAEYGLDMIMVDYLQLMSGEGRTENRVQEISYISRALKGLARELNVPLVAASQLSRAVEQRHDKRPILSDLRDSGSIEQDADVVMFLYRDELYNPDTELKNIADVIVSKHRHGPTGTVQLFFRKHLTQFVDAEVYHRNIEF